MDVRRSGYDDHPFPLRTLRADANDRHALWVRAGSKGNRGFERHDRGLRRGAGQPEHRIFVPGANLQRPGYRDMESPGSFQGQEALAGLAAAGDEEGFFVGVEREEVLAIIQKISTDEVKTV